MPVERYEGHLTGRTPEEVEEEVRKGVMLTTMDRAVSWARKQSMWPATFGLACCAIEMMSAGGMFTNYAIVQGVDTIVPVDIYVPGCPPRPETVIDGIMRLQDKIARSKHPILTEKF